MTYIDIIQHLFNVSVKQGIKLGLQNVQRLQHLLNFPERSFDSIHVAGTNGKGSVCLKIAQALQEAGYCVGLYTSPHISCFRERIRINGEMIPEKAVEAILPMLFKVIDKENIPATFFEITTFLAFLYFAHEGVDIAVLETGLGGRLDATNIVIPRLSIITSISLDHTEILGSTREEIAWEKGGIIKEGIPVVVGPQVPLEPLLPLIEQKMCPLVQVKKTCNFFENQNRDIAQAALGVLRSLYTLSAEAIESGLAASQPCRFEIVEGPPLIVLDVAHNPDGIFHLFQTVKERFPKRLLRLLFGLSKTKDVKGCLENIIPFGTHFHVVEATNERGASKEQLKAQLQAFSVAPNEISLHESIAEGVQCACKEALWQEQILVIFGTFFIMGEVRRALHFNDPFDRFDLNEKFSKNSCQDKAACL